MKNRAVSFVAVCLAFLVAGCAMSLTDKAVYYSLNYPGPTGVKEERSLIPDTLMIYKFLVAPDVDVDTIVVKSQTGKEIARGERWQENPADTITDLLIRDFQDANIFSQTISQLSDAKYRYALEGTLSTLEGRERGGKVNAVLEIEITLIDFEPRLGGKKVILNRRYKVEVPAKDSRSESLVIGFNQGLRQFSERLRSDVLDAVKSSLNSS
ncbi:MAG: ABC-type transport auxiliary lipoprotein family protein [Desulfomonilaceae bacterium]